MIDASLEAELKRASKDSFDELLLGALNRDRRPVAVENLVDVATRVALSRVGEAEPDWVGPRADLLVTLWLFGGEDTSAAEIQNERQNQVRAAYRGRSRLGKVDWLTSEDAERIVQAVANWVRFCSAPVTNENERRGSGATLGARSHINVVHDLAPGLDLHLHLVRARVFLMSLKKDARARRIEQLWHVPRAIVVLNERYAGRYALELLSSAAAVAADATGWRCKAHRLAAWLLFSPGFGSLLRGLLTLLLGIWCWNVLPVLSTNGAGLPFAILAGQLAIYLLRIVYEPAWLAAASYRRIALLAVGFGPLTIPSDYWRLLDRAVDFPGLAVLSTVLALLAAHLFVLTEVNAARGFAFRPRAWWPPREWTHTFASGRSLACSVHWAACRETFGVLYGRAFLIAWIATSPLAATHLSNPTGIEAHDLSAICMNAALAVVLGLFLQHLWTGASLGKSIEVPE